MRTPVADEKVWQAPSPTFDMIGQAEGAARRAGGPQSLPGGSRPAGPAQPATATGGDGTSPAASGGIFIPLWGTDQHAVHRDGLKF